MKAKHLAVLLVVLLGAGGNAFPWEPETYESICIDAAELCPTELRDLLNENIFDLKKGAVLPQTVFEDFENQVYFVSSGSGQAPAKIKAYFDGLVSMLQTSSVPSSKVARNFGISAAYLANMCEFPRVVDMGRQYMVLFEKSVQGTGKPPVLYDGHDAIGEADVFAIKLARIAEKQTSPGVCYNLAVNAVADYWTEAWINAGRPCTPAVAGKLLRVREALAQDPFTLATIEKAGVDPAAWSNPESRAGIEAVHSGLLDLWGRIYDQTGSLATSAE